MSLGLYAPTSIFTASRQYLNQVMFGFIIDSATYAAMTAAEQAEYVAIPTLTPSYFQGFHDNVYNWSTSSIPYANPTNVAVGTFTQRVALGLAVTTAAGNGAGIKFTPASLTAAYLVRAAVAFGTAGPNTVVDLRLFDGAFVIAQYPGIIISGQGDSVPGEVEGVYVPGVITPVTIILQAATGDGSAVGFTADGLGPTIEWTVIRIA